MVYRFAILLAKILGQMQQINIAVFSAYGSHLGEHRWHNKEPCYLDNLCYLSSECIN